MYVKADFNLLCFFCIGEHSYTHNVKFKKGGFEFLSSFALYSKIFAFCVHNWVQHLEWHSCVRGNLIRTVINMIIGPKMWKPEEPRKTFLEDLENRKDEFIVLAFVSDFSSDITFTMELQEQLFLNGSPFMHQTKQSLIFQRQIQIQAKTVQSPAHCIACAAFKLCGFGF